MKFTLLVVGLIWATVTRAAEFAPRQTYHLAGWTVQVSRELLDREAAVTATALDLLRAQLDWIVRTLPAPAVKQLQTVPLWVSPPYPGTAPKAEYHLSADWLRSHGRDPAMARGVEFTNVRIFAAEVRRMPVFVLHELAHAYHDRVLGHRHAGIKTAFAHAQASGRYDRVERQDAAGRKSFGQAYALTNDQEYFAESTEAFFGHNDFFPYTRDQLEVHDPEICAVLAAAWGTTAP
jgi:hypothetical protein